MLDHQQPENLSRKQYLINSLQEKLDSSSRPNELPDRLLIEDITELVDLFQMRELELNVPHMEQLARTLKNLGDLDPVTIFVVGSEFYLVDGHHRKGAYLECGKTDIPVTYLPANTTAQEAYELSMIANTKVSLNVTLDERLDAAWHLVQFGEKAYSKKRIRELSGASNGTIGRMRQVLNGLGNEALHIEHWKEARELYDEREKPEYDEDDIEAFLNAQAEDYADRLQRTFSNKLTTNPSLAARAFKMHFGRNLTDLYHELEFYLSDEEREGPGF